MALKILFRIEQEKKLESTKHVAQWIEHQIPILKVEGSIPFMLVLFFVISFNIYINHTKGILIYESIRFCRRFKNI